MPIANALQITVAGQGHWFSTIGRAVSIVEMVARQGIQKYRREQRGPETENGRLNTHFGPASRRCAWNLE